MKSLAVTLFALGASSFALAAPTQQPTPQARAKPNASAPQSAKPAAPVAVDETATPPSACVKMLREIAVFTPLPDRAGPGECGASDRVQLDAIKMPDGSRIAVSPAATLRCPMAESVAEWVRGELGKAAAEHGSPLRAIMTSASYDCRPRNGVKGAKISEHGRGNAIDIAGLKLANGTLIDLTRPQVSRELREQVRVSACSRFTTVLGPGSDAYHENHIHVDLAVRSRGHRMCQWEVRDEPVVASAKPAPAPAPAPTAAPPLRTLAAAKPSPDNVREHPAKTAAASAQADVPLPLRRPFELVFALRKSPER